MLLLHLICFFVVCGAGITALCVQVPLVSYACLAIGVAAFMCHLALAIVTNTGRIE